MDNAKTLFTEHLAVQAGLGYLSVETQAELVYFLRTSETATEAVRKWLAFRCVREYHAQAGSFRPSGELEAVANFLSEIAEQCDGGGMSPEPEE